MTIESTIGGEQVVDTFEQIHRERMSDVPILNDRLVVEWVAGFEDDDALVGVLITPWFMSLVRLPECPEAWSELTVGDEVVRHYPSGRYRFLVNEEPGLGVFQACSLFSPMFEFEDHAAARDTAVHALTALLDDDHQDAGDVSEHDIVQRWYPADNDADESADEVSAELGTENPVSPVEQPVASRRAFLRGQLSTSESV